MKFSGAVNARDDFKIPARYLSEKYDWVSDKEVICCDYNESGDFP
jgi:hypothetical protein